MSAGTRDRKLRVRRPPARALHARAHGDEFLFRRARACRNPDHRGKPPPAFAAAPKPNLGGASPGRYHAAARLQPGRDFPRPACVSRAKSPSSPLEQWQPSWTAMRLYRRAAPVIKHGTSRRFGQTRGKLAAPARLAGGDARAWTNGKRSRCCTPSQAGMRRWKSLCLPAIGKLTSNSPTRARKSSAQISAGRRPASASSVLLLFSRGIVTCAAILRLRQHVRLGFLVPQLLLALPTQPVIAEAFLK